MKLSLNSQKTFQLYLMKRLDVCSTKQERKNRPEKFFTELDVISEAINQILPSKMWHRISIPMLTQWDYTRCYDQMIVVGQATTGRLVREYIIQLEKNRIRDIFSGVGT